MYKSSERPAHERTAFVIPARQQGFKPRPAAPEPPKVLASALRVKNFRLLLDVAGDENLGIALDLNLGRVKELSEGINFSNETTHHIETSLKLISGFLDQVNPRLSDEDIARLKAPSRDVEDASAVSKTTVAVSPTTTAVPTNALPRPSTPASSVSLEAKAAVSDGMEEPSAVLSAVPSATPDSSAALPSNNRNERDKLMPQATAVNQSATQPPSLSPSQGGEEGLREVRRLNLLTLTNRAGAKTQLGRLTGLSAANVSHRLHGNKIFDKETADFFCERLGLPSGWFEQPRTEAEIPAATLKLLGDKSAPAGQPVAPRAQVTATMPVVLAPAAPQTGSVSLSAAALGKSAKAPVATVSQPIQAAPSPRSAAREAPARAPRATVAPVAVERNLEQAPVQISIASAALEPPPEGAVSAISEALIRTLAAKSRAGRLTDERALELLIEVAAL